MNEIIDKYFKDNSILYFHPADAIAAEHYLRYEYIGSRVIISVGSNDGETTVKLCSNPEQLENLIKTILF